MLLVVKKSKMIKTDHYIVNSINIIKYQNTMSFCPYFPYLSAQRCDVLDIASIFFYYFILF